MPVLDFDPVGHVYRLHGTIVPSVTDVLRPLENFARIPADALEYARERGTLVHEAMALLARNDLEWESLDDELLPLVLGGQRFLMESDITITASELRVYSERLRCAGTIDLAGHWHRRDVIIDFKATATVPASVGPQTSGYEHLFRDLFAHKKRLQRYCVHLLPNDYRVIPLEDSRDESIFLSALNLYHWGVQHGIAAAA